MTSARVANLFGRGFRAALAAGLASLLLCNAGTANAAATVLIINGDDPGTGFNDPTVVAPVGGNLATTLGAQRLAVFRAAADVWAAKLNSSVPISVLSFFPPLPCSATGAVLGAAGPISVWSDFTNAPRPGTWYVSALANKLAGQDLDTVPAGGNELDIVAFFNSELGKPGCFEGGAFYLGLDGQAAPNEVDLFSTVLHELGHGLGFLTLTDESTGEYFEGQPTIFDQQLRDNTVGKIWTQMSVAERAASAINPRNVVWTGPRVTRAAPSVLDRGAPELLLVGPGLNRPVMIGTADFGRQISRGDVLFGRVGRVIDQPNGLGLACAPLSMANAAAVRGRVALIDRGNCAVTTKVRNAQAAGATAVLIVDFVPGLPPADLSGVDPSITIPALRIAPDDGNAVKAALASGSNPFVGALLYANVARLAGADLFGRVLMYTPNPVEPGSSVSHFDTSARRNLLMEPFATLSDPRTVDPPADLTLPLLRDLGW